jgi:hypothetical protein
MCLLVHVQPGDEGTQLLSRKIALPRLKYDMDHLSGGDFQGYFGDIVLHIGLLRACAF